MAISLPKSNTASSAKLLFQRFSTTLNTFFDAVARPDTTDRSVSSGIRARRMNNFFKNNSKLLLIGAALLIGGILVGYLMSKAGDSSTILGDEDQKVDVENAQATQQINKSYSFPLKDSSGKEVSKINYTILTAERRDQLIFKGRRANAVSGRTFVILNLKVTNDFNRGIQINTRDYVRLIVNNSKERLAPDIHNDPVEIQAISTKYTRVGFPINENDKNLILQVGEINGKKEDIKLNLQ